MIDIKLKECPFCGGEAHLFVKDGVRVICPNCGATTKGLVDAMTARGVSGNATMSVIDAWNTRKPMDRIVEMLEEFEKENYQEENSGFIDVAIEIVKAGGVDG